jgi:tripartite-type tricarboxylate transporter receptor subunit TctC
MIVSRRKFTAGAGAASFLGVIGTDFARAQDYPNRDIHLICGFPAGTGADLIVRFYAEKIRALSGRTIVVENKLGAQSNIATEFVARSKPDGYTLYPYTGTTVAMTYHLLKNPPFDPGKELKVAATTSKLGFMLVVNADSPYKTVADLTAAMKKKGADGTYATVANPGTVMAALYKNTAGIEAIEVSYKSPADSLNELRTGKLDFAVHDPFFSLAQQREGRLRILAVGTSQRLSAASDIPTMKEAGVPIELDLWWGVMLPAATPRPIIDKINAWFQDINASEDTRKFLALSGSDPLTRSPDEAQEMFKKALVEWGDYVRIAKLPRI